MNEQHERTPPDDPWNITLTYRHERLWSSGANEEPESWHVSADVFDDSGTHVKSHVGDMIIVIVDIYQTRDPFGLLDGEDADLGAIAGTVFDARTGQLDPDLDDLLEPLGDRILILNSVRLTPEWRGFGLGVLLAGTAIKKLSGGVRAAVCYPAPIGEPADGEPDSPPHVSRPSRRPSSTAGRARDHPRPCRTAPLRPPLTFSALEAALLRPTTVPVHHDRDVARDAPGIDPLDHETVSVPFIPAAS